MPSGISEYYIREDGDLRLFVTGIPDTEKEYGFLVRAGNADCPVKSAEPVRENVVFKTLLMLDNSNSMKDLAGAKTLLKQAVEEHAEGEVFRLVTFDTRLTEVNEETGSYTDRYEALKAAIDAVPQANRDTDVNAALLEAADEAGQRTDGEFFRIITATDGGDSLAGSVSLRELEEKLEASPVTLHCIGAPWNSAQAKGLEDLSFLGKKFGSYISIQDPEASGQLSKALRSDHDAWSIEAEVPWQAQDGSVRSVHVRTENGVWEVSRDIRMAMVREIPLSPTPVPTQTPVPTPTPLPERNEIYVPAMESPGETPGEQQAAVIPEYLPEIAAGGLLLAVLIAGCALLLRKRRRGRNGEAEISPAVPEADDPERTELYEEGEEDAEEDGNETQFLFETPRKDPSLYLLLKDPADGEIRYRQRLTGNLIAGSSGRYSELVLEGDETVSRRHLRFSLEEDMVMAEDLESTNGTWLNRKKLTEKAPVRDGDLLRMGNSEFHLGLERGD